MKINLTQTVKNYDGTDIMNSDTEVLTVRLVILAALNDATDKHPAFTIKEMDKSYRLAKKLYEGDTMAIDTDDAHYIRERIADRWAHMPCIAVQCRDLFAGNDTQE